jgi:hypothetical protein
VTTITAAEFISFVPPSVRFDVRVLFVETKGRIRVLVVRMEEVGLGGAVLVVGIGRERVDLAPERPNVLLFSWIIEGTSLMVSCGTSVFEGSWDTIKIDLAAVVDKVSTEVDSVRAKLTDCPIGEVLGIILSNDEDGCVIDDFDASSLFSISLDRESANPDDVRSLDRCGFEAGWGNITPIDKCFGNYYCRIRVNRGFLWRSFKNTAQYYYHASLSCLSNN